MVAVVLDGIAEMIHVDVTILRLIYALLFIVTTGFPFLFCML